MQLGQGLGEGASISYQQCAVSAEDGRKRQAPLERKRGVRVRGALATGESS